MRDYLENTLHQPVVIENFTETNKLPLSLRNNYGLYYLDIGDIRFLLAEPKGNYGLAELRKNHKRLEQLTDCRCVLYLDNTTAYSVSKMIEEGIPFIIENKQIYIPFIGISLAKNKERILQPCNEISFLTQKILITAIYEEWERINVTQAAQALNVTKTSITRCFDEIEALSIPVMKKYGRNRYIFGASNKKNFWNLIKNFLRNPLIRTFAFDTELENNLVAGGFSALAQYSMLADNDYPTYAVAKENLKELQISKLKQTPNGETPVCVLQELGYMIKYKNINAVDPLTLYLLFDKENNDPRIEIAIDEMLEEYVW